MNLRGILRQPRLTLAIHDREVRWTVGSGGATAHAASCPLPPGMVDDGVVRDSAALGRLLREHNDFPGRNRMRTVIGLPAHRSVLRTIEIPAIKGRAFDELAQREVRREMPMLGEHAYVSWTRATDRGDKAQLFVAGIARDVMDSHVAAVRAARLEPSCADLRVIAAARALGQRDCILAHIEPDELEVAIVRARVPVIVRVVTMLPADDLRQWGRQFVDELARSVKFYRDSHRDDHDFDAVPISVVGGAAHAAQFADALLEATEHPLAAPRLVAPDIPAAERPRYAANLGLAQKDLAA